MNYSASNEQQPLWLVKSAGQILGPYTLKDLKSALVERKLTIIDEVKLPGGRWGFIREQSQLKDLVEVIRGEDLDKYEETGVVLENTRTVTEPSHELDDKTQIPIPKLSQWKEALSLKSPGGSSSRGESFESDPTRPRSIVAKEKKVRSPEVEFANEGRGLRVFLGFLFVAVISIGVYFVVDPVQKHLQTPEIKSTVLSPEEVSAKINEKLQLGLYAQAVELVLQLENRNLFSAELKESLIPVLVSENQNLLARQWVDQLISQVSNEKKSKFLLYRALASMREGNFVNAQSDLQQALKQAPQQQPDLSESIQLNISINQSLQGAQEESFATAQKISWAKNQNLVWKALSLLRINSVQGSSALGIRLVEAFKKADITTTAFRNEVFLLVPALLVKAEQFQEAEAYLQQILGYKWTASENFLPLMDADSQVLRGSQYLDICEKTVQSKPSPQGKILKEKPIWKIYLARCLALRGDLVSALKTVEEARIQNPKEGMFILAQAELFTLGGRVAEARGLLSLNEAKSLESSRFLRGALCLDDKDLPCLKEFLPTVTAEDLKDPVVADIWARSHSLLANGVALDSQILAALPKANQVQYRPLREWLFQQSQESLGGR